LWHRYRDAGREVINVICEFSEVVQRASVDEAYIDLTEAVAQRLTRHVKVSAAQLDNTFVVGYPPETGNDEGDDASVTVASYPTTKGPSPWPDKPIYRKNYK
jgi:DNA polymerase eta